MGNLGLKGLEGFKTLEWKLGDIDTNEQGPVCLSSKHVGWTESMD